MSEKIRLLELASKKVETDSNFIAYLMKQYLEIEGLSQKELISTLQCSEENYYKLILCKVPDIDASDYVTQLKKISEYTNSSSVDLNRIIKRANSIIQLSGENAGRAALIAARDKQNKDKT